MYYANRVYDGVNWRLVSDRTVERQDPRSNPRDVRETTVTSQSGRQKLVWHWYYLSGRSTSNDTLAKILNVRHTLRNKPEIAVFVIATDLDQSYDEAQAVLASFTLEVLPALERAVDAIEVS